MIRTLQRTGPDHYATLGLDRNCTAEQIRSAYRLLAKHLHPDVNGGSADAKQRTQQLNAAYEILSNPERRQTYETELAREEKCARTTRSTRAAPIAEDVYLRLDEFFRGTTLDVRVNDPGNPGGPEVYSLAV